MDTSQLEGIFFNTGRHYSADGQPIYAEAIITESSETTGGQIRMTRQARFHDQARDIFGQFDLGSSPLTQSTVMGHYDSGNYTDCRPFEPTARNPDRLYRLSNDGFTALLTQDAVRAIAMHSDGASLSVNEPILDVVENIGLSHLPRCLDDNSWPGISQSLLRAERDPRGIYPEQTCAFPVTPVDLPAGLAEQRLFAISRYHTGSQAEFQVSVELVELLMADKHQRALNQALFSEEALDADLFFDPHDDNYESLEEKHDNIAQQYGELSAEADVEMTLYGDSWAGSGVYLSLMQVELSELEYLLEHHPSNSESLALG